MPKLGLKKILCGTVSTALLGDGEKSWRAKFGDVSSSPGRQGEMT